MIVNIQKESTKQECVLWAREQRNNSKVKTVGELSDSTFFFFFFVFFLTGCYEEVLGLEGDT